MSLQHVAPLVSIDGRVMSALQIVTPLTIRVGRESPNSQPESNTCSFGLLGVLPPEVRMNAPVEVYLAWGEGGIWDDVWDDLWSDTVVDGDPEEVLTRFVGRVTDLTPTSEGGLMQAEVVATGRMSDLGRVKSGWYDFPEESENARLIRLSMEADTAGLDLVGEGYTWIMAKRPLETASVLDILYDTATAGGLVHETVGGVTQFDHWQAREDNQPVAHLPASAVEDAVAWSQQIDAFVKRAIIRYGTPAEGNSEQPQVTVGERGWGKPETVISTFLRDSADAKTFGELVLSRWGDPHAFEAPILNLVATVVDADTWDAIMGLQFGDVIVVDGVTPIPMPLPQGTNEWYVEGWSEEYDRNGQGIIQHRVALSVSDRSRFRPDLGVETQIVDVVVSPQEADYGVARNVTATVLTADGEPVLKGKTYLMKGTLVLETDTTPGSDGSVVFSLEGDALPYGSHILTIAYQDFYPEYLASTANTDAVIVNTPDSDIPLASCSLTISTDVVNAGETVKNTATIGMTMGASKAGKVNFQVSRDNGASWTTWKSVETTKTSEVVTATWTSSDGTLPCLLRAVFNPTLAGVANATSTSKEVDVRQKVTRTQGYNSLWANAYEGDGDLIGVGMHQGYVEGRGNRKSLARFTLDPAEWEGWTITKVEVYLDFYYWRNNSGTARLGSHKHFTMPPSDPTYEAGKTTVSSWGESAKWVNITSWAKGIATGTLAGVVLGPGSDQSAKYVGVAYAVGSTQCQLRVTGYRWE